MIIELLLGSSQVLSRWLLDGLGRLLGCSQVVVKRLVSGY